MIAMKKKVCPPIPESEDPLPAKAVLIYTQSVHKKS